MSGRIILSSFFTRRWILIFLAVFAFILLISSQRRVVGKYAHAWAVNKDKDADIQEDILWYGGGKLAEEPPKYEKLYQWERDLPQHNLDLPLPEGRHGRYIKFSNQIRGLGWNNIFNEILLCTHLAYVSKRAYVFQDYVWKPEYFPWRIPVHSWENGPSWPHTPLNALIAGPTTGGAWDPEDDAPRSINEPWFDQACPQSERRIIYTDTVKPALREAGADEILAAWKKLLLEAPERCIEIVAGPSGNDSFPQVFDLWVIGTTRLVSIWDEFSKSPTSRLLGTSPLVKSAVNRNEYLFNPRGPRPPHPVSRDPYERMMVLHVRRGDFREACVGLVAWNSTYYGWNLLPFLPDNFIPLPGGGWGVNTPENVEKYMEHCLPTFDAIVQKIKDSRTAYVAAGRPGERTLDVVFLATNAEKEWLDQLKSALMADGWHTIVTSKDLELDQEQIAVNMAVDMDIARRAAVFIGNGWSSLTSNIVHRRLVDGKEHISTRFW